ncbi:MAG: hypothetical protein U0892_18055 [Pirellulales bacterium]
MARKAKGNGVSKSQLIRDARSAKPDAGPSEIAAIIKSEHGVEVSPAMVSTVLSQDKSRGGKPAGKRGRPKKGAAATKSAGRPAAKKPQADLSLDALVKIKKMAEEVGGIEQAKAALDALAKILG